ncbi:MAG: hypothetical protein KF824_09245 [Fimbriimonadaceae bacterium]|nr:MAG: hypothetical protein KF824_09245 [Fimbriimonadaceae bacterium]
MATAEKLSGGVYEPGMIFLGAGFQRVLRLSVFESGLTFGSLTFGKLIWPRALPTFIPWNNIAKIEESQGLQKGHNIFVRETPGLWRIYIRNLPEDVLVEIRKRIQP